MLSTSVCLHIFCVSYVWFCLDCVVGLLEKIKSHAYETSIHAFMTGMYWGFSKKNMTGMYPGISKNQIWREFTQGLKFFIYPVISNSRMIFRNWKGLEGGRAAQKNMSNIKLSQHDHINFTAWIFVWPGNHLRSMYIHIYIYICVHISPWHCAARLAPQRWMLLPAYAGPNGRDVWMEGLRMLDN